MISGETVVIEHKSESGVDAMGDHTYGEPTLETVENVLIQPSVSSELAENTRPDGVIVQYTLHFPKTYTQDLTGLRIQVRGVWHEVIGTPCAYTVENTPTKWNMPVEVKRVDG